MLRLRQYGDHADNGNWGRVTGWHEWSVMSAAGLQDAPSHPMVCACGACAASGAGDGPQAAVLPSSGVAANGKPIFSWDQAAVQIGRENDVWGGVVGQAATVTYAYRSTAPSTMPDDTTGFVRFSEAQIAATEKALQYWSDVANITFVRVGAGTSGNGAYSNAATILFADYTTGAVGASAFAYFPGQTGSGSVAGDVWVNSSIASNASPDYFTAGPRTLLHEIGHAIGLSHPSEYNAAEGLTITYAADAIYWQDANMFTVMSYFASASTGANLGGFANSPQMHDIAAAQRLYGANLSTRTGDTVYGFNSNSGRENTTILSAGQAIVFSLWDGGGDDTLDLSGYSQNADIDLRPESFTSAGPDTSGGGALYNISIPRGVTIERAIGGSGADTITGNDVANALQGNGGADMLQGRSGADTLIGGAGNDFLYGEDSSGVLLTANALTVSRLYLATLDRAPDPVGWAAWTGQLDAGISLATITSGFILSPEFRTTYGALDNTQFVTLLYANVLHRAADPAGLNGWLSVLNSGGTREGVVNGFSQSPEFRLTSDTANYGAQVFRLYGATLDRAPDPVGFAGWTNVLSNNDTLDAIAAGFVNSLEFQTVYGALNNTQFVTLLYANVLDRAPDPAGLNGWLGVLAGGASRTSVVLGFSESSEYQVSTRAGYVAFSTSNFATSNDRLDGGAGDDLLVAGQGADTFVFTQGQGGTDHIYGLETIDHVSLLGFGYSSAAQAESHLTQVGADLVFADQGQTIIFHNFYLANFYDDIWGFG